MPDELSDEQDQGAELAKQLVQHVCEMGAAGCSIPVVVADETYEVIVCHKPVV